MVRACQRCGSEFKFEYVGRGRPRACCFECQPEGTPMVKSANTSRVKVSAEAAQ
jgi:hypothetical protein